MVCAQLELPRHDFQPISSAAATFYPKVCAFTWSPRPFTRRGGRTEVVNHKPRELANIHQRRPAGGAHISTSFATF
jgi:hypothetical protein